MSMEHVKASGVDPRYVSQEELDPVYRVDFWDENRASDEYRLENAQSVHDVVSWAEANRHGRHVVIWVEYAYEGGTGLTRLLGWEPTDESSPAAEDPCFLP